MQSTIRLFLKEFWRNRTKRRRMQSVVLAMSFLVAFGVLWQLRITGITMTGEALCGYSQHEHSAQCEGAVLTCALEESQGHSHDAVCSPEPELNCQLTPHVHDGESCIMAAGEDGAEVCTLTEHTHGEGCYTTPEPCALEEGAGHTHSSACYTCEVPVHTHTVLCYSNREADLETSAVWEGTLPALSEDGNYAADVAAVALSQLGYTESKQNYDVSDDGVTQRGYTRYGEWYGNPYGDWSAMFASFCLHYGSHPAYEVLANSGVEAMRLQAENQQCYAPAGAHEPNVGDLVFLDRDGNGNAEAVAIVIQVSETGIQAVEGDYENAVAANTLAKTDAAIKGWAVLSAPGQATLDEPPVEDMVTVTFVVNDPNYTSDPGTGDTHLYLAAKEPIEGGDLTYTKWTSNRWWVTGTGTVCTYTIPAGTSVYGNGLKMPALSVENITDSNTNTYISSRSWVNAEGRLYSKDTVIRENTTLYLSLYQNGED